MSRVYMSNLFFFGQSKLPLNQNKPETRSIQRPTAKKHQNSISTNQNQKPTPKNKKLQSTNKSAATKFIKEVGGPLTQAVQHNPLEEALASQSVALFADLGIHLT